jgi:hypothetical protein
MLMGFDADWDAEEGIRETVRMFCQCVRPARIDAFRESDGFSRRSPLDAGY